MLRKILVVVSIVLCFCGATVLGAANENKAAKGAKKPIDTVVVGYYPTNINSTYHVGMAKKFYDQYGIKIERKEITAATDIATALEKDKVDIALSGIIPALRWADAGMKIKIVSPDSNGGLALVVKRGGAIKSFSDLKGKKIAVYQKGSTQEFILRYMIKSVAKLPLTAVNIVYMPEDKMLKAVKDNQIDGYVARTLVAVDGLEQGVVEQVASKDKSWNQFPFIVVVASEKFMKNRPETLRRFLQARAKALDFVNTHRAESLKILAAAKNDPVSYVNKALGMVKISYKPTTQWLREFSRMISIEKELGEIKNISAQDVYDFSFNPK